MNRPGGGPAIARLIARWLLPVRDREFILGDIEELHSARVRRIGRRLATGLYWRDVIISVVARSSRRFAVPPHPRGRLPGSSNMLRDIFSDLEAAARSMMRAKGFSLVVILTLSLGVGSSAAVFGMVNQLLLRPLEGTHSERAAYLNFRSIKDPERTDGRGIAFLDFQELRAASTLLRGMASYGRSPLRMSVREERPVRVMANIVYGDFFEILGVRPASGRLLRAAETELTSDPFVAVISWELAVTHFGNSEAAVGRTMRLNGEAVTVLGVTETGFAGPERGANIEIWVPYPAMVALIGFDIDRLTSRQYTGHDDIIVQLRAGIAANVAEEQIADILQGLAAEHPESTEWLASLRPMLFTGLHIPPLVRERTYGSLRLQAGIVLLVLIISCANVANLLLFRSVRRRSAVATRRALGASTGRIARAHLAESLTLSTLGTLAGLGVAWLVTLPFRGESLARLPSFEAFAIDWRVLAFAGLASVVTAGIFGTVPAFLEGRFDLGAALKGAGGGDARRIAWFRWGMSAGQIALCLSLLIGGILLAQTVRNLYAVDTGLSIEGVWELSFDRPRALDAEALRALDRRVLAAVAQLPDVEGAALAAYGPHGARMGGRIALPGVSRDEALRATITPISPGWFEIFDVGILHGRPFRGSDWDSGGPGGVILTASLARRLFGRTDVVGRTIQAGFGGLDEVEIIGVTDDIRMAWDLSQPLDAFFVLFGSSYVPYYTLMVRNRVLDPQAASQVRIAVEGIFPDEPIADPSRLTARVDRIHSERRLFGLLLGVLSGLGVILAAVGLYGVIAFTVAGRTKEFGIRLALGATGSQVARLVLREAAAIVVAGTLVGLVGAYTLTRLIESQLFGVEVVDPASYGSAALLLGVVAVLACLTPAQAATRVDPVEALRME